MTKAVIRRSRATLLQWLIGLLALSLAGMAAAEAQTFHSGPQAVNLIELYTSEGCSSCPPADRWLSRLQNHEGLWQRFVPLAFHVDYWDYLGWPDDFARAEFSSRQRRYDRLRQVNGVYTPGVLLNGREWRQWRRGEQSYGDIERSARDNVGELTLARNGEEYRIHFSPATERTVGKVYVALLGAGMESDIGAGENRGKVLRHDFVVLDFAETSLQQNGKVYVATMDAFPLTRDAERFALAAWITDAEDRQPLQAVGGWLER